MSDHDDTLARLKASMAGELPAMAAEVIAEIGRSVPEYRRPLEGVFGHNLRAGVQSGLREFLAVIGERVSSAPLHLDVYAQLGRGELEAGRSLDSLQAAYRIGARVAWRRLSEAARSAGADAETVARLAGALFAYIDELSAASVDGYARAQAALAGEHELRRQRLVRLALAEEPPEAEALAAAARAAGWALPRRLAVLVARHDDPARLAARIGAVALGARVGELACVLVGDPDASRRHAEVARATGEAPAALGASVVPAESRRSFLLARDALELLGPSGLLIASEHVPALLMARERELLGELAARRLEPLGELSERARERLVTTLAAWLDTHGSVVEMAARLHVHPQTVRYRLGRLRDLFGAELDDADVRFELQLALRGQAYGNLP